MKTEGNCVHYIHKLWSPIQNDCSFGDLESKVEDLQKPQRFAESKATAGTRAMTPDALKIAREPGNHFRQLDLAEMRAGLLEPCSEEQGSTASDVVSREGIAAVDVRSITFEGSSFKMHTKPPAGP